MYSNVCSLFMRALCGILLSFFYFQGCNAFGRADQTQPELLPEYEAVVENGVMNLTCLYINLVRPTTITFQHSTTGRMLITVVPNATVLEVDKNFKYRNYEVLVHRIDRQHYLLRRFTAAISLLLHNATDIDRGEYWCHVNALRSVGTTLINVVRKLPMLNFTVTPRSVVLGNSVSALCAAQVDDSWDMKSNFALEVIVPAAYKDVTSVQLLPLSSWRNDSVAPGWTSLVKAYAYRPLRPADGREFVPLTCQIVDYSECLRTSTAMCKKIIMLSRTENVFVLPEVTNQASDTTCSGQSEVNAQPIVTLSVYTGAGSALLSCFSPFGETFGVDYYVYSDSRSTTASSLQSQPMSWLFSQRREPLSDVVAPPASNFDYRSKLPVNVTSWYADRGLRVSRVRVSVTESMAPSFIFRCRIRNEFGEIDSPLTRLPAAPVVQLPQSVELPLDMLVAPVGRDVVVACTRFDGAFRVATLSVTTAGVVVDVAVALRAISLSGRTYLKVVTADDQFSLTTATLSLSDADYWRALNGTGVAPTNNIFFLIRNLTVADAALLAFSCRVQTDLAAYSSSSRDSALPDWPPKPILFASPTELQSDCKFVCLFPNFNLSIVRTVLLASQTTPNPSSFYISPMLYSDQIQTNVVNPRRLHFAAAQFYEEIRFQNVTQSDDVYYACSVVLKNVSQETNILSAFVPIPLYRSTRSLSVKVSQPLVSDSQAPVACELTNMGYPLSFLTLAYANGSSQTLNRTLAFQSCDSVAVSSLTPNSSSNGGSLICEAYNPAALDTAFISSALQLEVLYPVANIDVYVEPRHLLATAMVNGYEVLAVTVQAQILCRADGNPASEAVWLDESNSPYVPVRSQLLNASALPVQSYLDFIPFRCSASNTVRGTKHSAYRVFGVRVIRGPVLNFYGHDPTITLPTIASVLSVSVLVLISVIVALRSRISNYMRHHSVPILSRRSATRASHPFRIRYSAHANASASNPYGRMMEDEYDGGVQIEFTPDNVPDEAPPAYDAVSRLPPTELNIGYRRPLNIRMPPPAYDASFIPDRDLTSTIPQPQPFEQPVVAEGSTQNT